MRDHATTTRPGQRRGVTLLEVVLAAAVVALIAATVTSGFSYAYAMQTRQQRSLAAAELANRLVLMYLDDEHSMPSAMSTIAYGRDEYRFEIRSEPIRTRPSRAVVEASAASGRTSPISPDRMRQITVHVWLSERSGGALTRGERTPRATTIRLYDPMHRSRNPDSGQAFFDRTFGADGSDEARRELLEQLLGGR